MIPTDIKKCASVRIIFTSAIISARARLEREKKFELIDSDEYEKLLDDPNYIKMDSPEAAMIGFSNKNFHQWKITQLESINDSLRNKLIKSQRMV